jgi:tetratricopeptide (TPR) repeat protein
MSLAQVASGVITRTAVYLAETGKTRPTMPTIQLIAARTGKPLDYFLDPGGSIEVQGVATHLDKLRDLAATEDLHALRLHAESTKLGARDAMERAWGGFYLAQALIRLANPRPALVELREARRVFETAGDQWMVVECMDWESAGLNLLEDSSALELAEAALSACRRLRPTDRYVEARILGRLASIRAVNHQWSEAVEYYGQAIEVAGELKDLGRLGKMYNDLGCAYEHLGDLPRARSLSQKAIAIHELLHDRLSVARAENNLGMVLIRQGDLDGAREHLNRSLSICDETGLEVGKSHVLLSLAELDLGGGDPDGARRQLEQAREICERSNEKGTLAQVHQMLGHVAEATDKRARTDQEFRLALSILEQAALSQRLISCLTDYAKILENRGDTDGALDHMKRAVAVTRPDLDDSEGSVGFRSVTYDMG